MYAFSIPLRLAIEERVFVLGPHLGLGRHFRLPSLDRFRRLSLPRREGGGALQGRSDGGDHVVHHSEPFALARFLGRGQSPRNFPKGERRGRVS